MTTALLEVIKGRIRDNGPINLSEYMGLCLGHPEHGYYMTRDPFGARGDFITAPEISQMFGEMIGVWLADTWIKLGSPKPFILLECGPGRGTLMKDALRATANVPRFHEAMRIYLLEISPVLKQAQAHNLDLYQPVWIDDIAALPGDCPVLIIANEFLDALPIRQLERVGDQWLERCVGLDDKDDLLLKLRPIARDVCRLEQLVNKDKTKNIYEFSLILNAFLKRFAIILSKQGGAGLFIDYGYVNGSNGDSLQAMKDHRFETIFETPGLCDITAHVDFGNLIGLARDARIETCGPIGQGDFLSNLGIKLRADMLMQNASEEQRHDIVTALHRLTHPDLMGNLFKVAAMCHDPKIRLAGFNDSIL